MKNKNLIITWIFTLILFVMCVGYSTKEYNVSQELAVTKGHLQMANDNITEFLAQKNALELELKKANTTIEDLKSTEYEFVYLGNFKLTAYCACEICCEEWALNRPKDENGNPIVYTATGTVAKQGRTIGVNPKVIPYGTAVYIEGLGFRTAEDTGGGIGKQHIDVYMDSHEAALQSGLSKGDVWILVKKS